MKKKLLMLAGLITVLVTVCFTTQAQDTIKIAYAKKVFYAIKNRPNSEFFSEDEAIKVITGEKIISKDYQIIQTEHKWLGLMKKDNTVIQFYNYSETGWWYTNTRSFTEGKWEIDWYPVGTLLLATLAVFLIESAKYVYSLLRLRLKSN